MGIFHVPITRTAKAIGRPGATYGFSTRLECLSAQFPPLECFDFIPSAFDVWYTFQTISVGNITIVVNSDGPLGLEVIADPGQTSGNSACGENAQNSIPLSNLAIGTYYFRVYSYSQSPMVFTISAFGSALPVELSQFTGQVKEQENTLYWETQTEKNVAWHVVERSAEGTNLPSPVHHSTPTPTRPPRPGIGRKANI